MQITDIQNLIDNKLEPNAQEWAMDVEDILTELDSLTPEGINENEQRRACKKNKRQNRYDRNST